ncbi:PAS domain-containing hybrid sensor histidine kinase/response regulator, partial [Desulfopila aestuarii]
MKKFYPQRLYYQIASLLLVIIITSFFAFGFITASKQTELLHSIMTESAAKMTKGLADSCIRYFLISDYAGLDELLAKFIVMSGAEQIQVYREDGRILSEVTRDASSPQGLKFSLNRHIEVSDGEEDIRIEDDLMIISQPIASINVLGWARITFSLKYIDKMRHDIWVNTGLSVLFWSMLSVAIFMLIFKRFTGLIEQISAFSRNLGNLKGELIDVRHGPYEIQQLCESLNYASTDLFKKEKELKAYREGLEKLVTTRTTELEKEIDERMRAERVIKESEERYRLLAENATDIIWTLGIDMQMTYVSPSVTHLLGFTPEEVMARTVEQIYTPSSLERVRAIFTHAFDKDWHKDSIQSNVLELSLICKDGNYLPVEGNFSILYSAAGHPQGLLSINRNISERKIAEQNYQTLFQEMLDGFVLHEIICDNAGTPVDYRFLAVNRAFERMTNLKATDVIGRTVMDVLPGTERHWIDTYGRVALTGEPAYFENTSEDLHKHFIVTAFRPAQGQFACIFTDITDQKKAEVEREYLQSQLSYAQKMEAIGTLAGGIAHDFNNILSAMLGYAEMVREDSPEGTMAARDLDQVLIAGHRAKELVKQILAFSRQAETERIPLQPAIIVNEVIKLLRASIPTTIAIEQDIDLQCDLILADPVQVHQILMNLCTNAFHAMEVDGGTLSISLKMKTLSQQELIHESQLLPGNYIQLSVRDTGTGIEPGIQKKIFDPYFTTKELGKGTGMGLAITHGIIKSYGGFITCESQLGEGTVFTINLPVSEESILSQSNFVDSIVAGTERILFIDDEQMLADMGKTMLERLGYKVTVRMSSIEALATFKNQPDAFDLVITDQTMPGMTGSDLARRILQIRPEMPIILCTGFSNQISEEKARLFGIKGFAMKPLAKKDLATLIRKVLNEV